MHIFGAELVALNLCLALAATSDIYRYFYKDRVEQHARGARDDYRSIDDSVSPDYVLGIPVGRLIAARLSWGLYLVTL